MAAPVPGNYPATPKPTPSSTPAIGPEQPPTRNRFFKPALIALGVVLIIVLSEIGYLVFKGYNKTYFQPAPTPAPTPPTQEEIENTLPREGINPYKARDFADLLDKLKPKEEFVQTASMNFTVAGVLINAGPEKGEEEGLEYVYQITLRGEGEPALTFTDFLTEQEIQNATIFLHTSEGTSQIKITEIKPGDFVSIRHITNLLDASPHSKIILEAIRE